MYRLCILRAGYFGKIVLLLAQTLKLSKSVSDCNTRYLVTVPIKSKKVLKKFNGRFYKTDLNEYDYKLINAREDEHLIGKTLYFRSPVTCACGDEVCHKCFGTTSLLNLDIADGVSGFEVEETTKVVEVRLTTINLFNCGDILLTHIY